MTQPKVYIASVLLLLLAGCIMVQGSVAAGGQSVEPFEGGYSGDSLGAGTAPYLSPGTARSLFANNSFSGAYFTGSPLEGDAPLTVAFMDLSAQTGDAWYWDFGDGGTSQEQHPVHTFTIPGTYSVTLTITRKVSHPGSEYEFSSTITRDDYILVHGIPPTPVPTLSPISSLPSLTPRYTPSAQGLNIAPSIVTIRPLSPGSPSLVPPFSAITPISMARYAFVSGSGTQGNTNAPVLPSSNPALVRVSPSTPTPIRPC